MLGVGSGVSKSTEKCSAGCGIYIREAEDRAGKRDWGQNTFQTTTAFKLYFLCFPEMLEEVRNMWF